MKKYCLLLGAALVMGAASYAGDGNKEGAACCKGKKEACAKEKKEACDKGKGCCKKGEEKKEAPVKTQNASAKEGKKGFAK